MLALYGERPLSLPVYYISKESISHLTEMCAGYTFYRIGRPDLISRKADIGFVFKASYY